MINSFHFPILLYQLHPMPLPSLTIKTHSGGVLSCDLVGVPASPESMISCSLSSLLSPSISLPSDSVSPSPAAASASELGFPLSCSRRNVPTENKKFNIVITSCLERGLNNSKSWNWGEHWHAWSNLAGQCQVSLELYGLLLFLSGKALSSCRCWATCEASSDSVIPNLNQNTKVILLNFLIYFKIIWVWCTFVLIFSTVLNHNICNFITARVLLQQGSLSVSHINPWCIKYAIWRLQESMVSLPAKNK